MRTTSFFRKIAAVTLVVVLILPVFPPRATSAAMPVIDPTNLVQNIISATNAASMYTLEYVLDTLAWQAANLAIESMTKSLVNWINSGFQGSPAFVTDLNNNLRGVGDAVANQFFNELAMAYGDIQLSPFQDKVLDAVRLGYYLHTSPESFYTRNPYTLNQVSPDARAFLQGDFSQGGWNAWFATVMNPQNNPYGAQMLAEEALSNVVGNATGNRVQELSWNRGFLSWRGECAQMSENADVIELSGADPCISYEIETPGSVIMEQLNTQLGAGVNRLVSADEFNEIIGALLNQLVLKVVGGGGSDGGLRGVSRPSTGGGGSFVNQPTGPGSSGTGSNPTTVIGATFAATLTNQRNHLIAYQANWQRLQDAANSAAQRCPMSSNPNAVAIREQANQELVQVANILATLATLEQRIAAATAAGGNQSIPILEISEEYNALILSPEFPTGEDLAFAATNAQDSGDEDPASLYTQLMRMTTGSCSQ